MSDAGGIDKNSIGGSLFNHFGIAGSDRNMSPMGCLADAVQNPLQVGGWEAFFDNQGQAQRKRLGAADGQVIDRTADSQFADIPAGEKQRLNHKAVGRKQNPAVIHADFGSIGQRGRRRIHAGTDGFTDKLGHQPAAPAMGK